MAMAGIVVVLAVGPAFGIEGNADLADIRPQALQHVDDDMIVADQQAVMVDLGRQMPVAEMPGQPCERRGIAAAHLDEILLGGPHLDEAALLQLEPVTAMQHHRLDQIEQEIEPTIAQHAQAPTVAIVEQQSDGIDALGRCPLAGPHDVDGAFHGQNRK